MDKLRVPGHYCEYHLDSEENEFAVSSFLVFGFTTNDVVGGKRVVRFGEYGDASYAQSVHSAQKRFESSMLASDFPINDITPPESHLTTI